MMWDFLPVNFNEVKQIEVIRGPASAVWGANALYGVVNVITKSPREMQGTSATLGFGGFDRPDADAGSLWYVSGTHAQAPNDRWAYKLSGGGYSQDRAGAADRADSVRSSRGLPGHDDRLPAVRRTGHDAAEVRRPRRLRLRGRAQAVVLGRRRRHRRHHALRHRAVRHQQRLGDGLRARRTTAKGGFRAGFFTNILNGDADHLLTRGLNGAPITFDFDTKTFDFEASNVQTFAQAPRRQLRRQPALQHASICRSRRTPTTARSSASTARTRSSCPTCSAGSSARASIASTTSTTSCSRRGRRS